MSLLLTGGMLRSPRVSIDDRSVIAFAISPNDATATYQLNPDGTVSDHTTNVLETWVEPTVVAPGPYEVRATLQSGVLSSGVTGTWQALTVGRSWSTFQSGSGQSSAEILVEIRNGTTVLDSAIIGLSADVAAL